MNFAMYVADGDSAGTASRTTNDTADVLVVVVGTVDRTVNCKAFHDCTITKLPEEALLVGGCC